MKLKDKINAIYNQPNDLNTTYTLLQELPKKFRDSMSEECGWSEATFYRKAKVTKRFSAAEKDKLVQVLSFFGKEIDALCNAIANNTAAAHKPI